MKVFTAFDPLCRLCLASMAIRHSAGRYPPLDAASERRRDSYSPQAFFMTLQGLLTSFSGEPRAEAI